MSYVVYQTSKVTVSRRQRTPIGRIGAWLVMRAGGTSLQRPLRAIVQGSLLTSVALAIVISLAFSFLIEFIISFAQPTISTFATAVIIGALAGGAGGGIVGGILGALLGWVIGGIRSVEISRVKSALDSCRIKCYKLSHGTSTQNRVSWRLVPCDEPGKKGRNNIS